MIEELIENEMEYFKPMLERQKLVNKETRMVWKDETVAQRLQRISIETYDLCKGKVCSGLFKGLKLNKNTWWGKSDLGSQCLGLYEKEILNLLENKSPFDTFLDVGAADGYYAVGMLHSKLAKKSICFEVSNEGRLAIRKNWLSNKRIGELEIYGEANESSITKITSKMNTKSLVLIDIEGSEFALLTPNVISMLKEFEIIIEIHNWVDNFSSRYKTLLLNLFEHFEIKPITRVVRCTEQIPLLRSYTDDNRLLLASEQRPCLMRFLHLVPHNKFDPLVTQ